MTSNITTILEDGNSGILVNVECHLSNSLPNIVIVGIANKAVDEAKERIRGAFASSSIKLPKKRITLNLAPADIPKEGSSYDLPMIVAILHSSNLIKHAIPPDTVILGEIGLDGSTRPIRGIIGKILSARKLGIVNYWVPEKNLNQAQLVPGINVWPIKNLKEIYNNLNSETLHLPYVLTEPEVTVSVSKSTNSFDEIAGQEISKRALTIAAAGHHNIMLDGPPGTGKSMLAKALPDILPSMSQEEMLEVTHIHSLASKNFNNIIYERPLRSPHHSSSHIAIVGGGQHPTPGEISLSHQGILFLDEFPEFARNVIESLRQPLEDRKITVARARASIDFPANFILVATANPCPCGYYGSKKECICMATQIQKYQKKISGPIVDRIDLYVTVDEVPHSKILKTNSNSDNQTKSMARAVSVARQIQIKRSGKLNNTLSNRELQKVAQLDETTLSMFNQAAQVMGLSGRGYIRTLKVARTIADIEESPDINSAHISEALQYRKKEFIL